MTKKNSQGRDDKPDYRDRETLAALLGSAPFHQQMGYELGETDPEKGMAEVLQPFQPGVCRMAGSEQIHGGVIASLIDVAGTFAMVAYLNKGVPTVDLRVDYLRPAAGTELRARATVRKAGRTVGTVDIEVTDSSDRLIAIGRALFATGV